MKRSGAPIRETRSHCNARETGMPPRILFTPENHRSHRATDGGRLGLNRPYPTIEEHDEALIARRNAAVGPGDILWHLGDVCHRCPVDWARAIFARFSGRRRFLVRGKHEKINVRLAWDVMFAVARVPEPLAGGGVQGVWCSHYIQRDWLRLHHGDI
ncbi:hypothetical protein SAMN04488144_12120 [Methylobacterium sp. 190mf]|uniref:metallophosphoesterase n=1 Tax=Methylobacterium sp. 190mf TaxID=1761798 RepID=UPI00089F7CC5|nr:metallophosphoesterase [Methylobacterium sp. 190mf]SEG52096.1 hypothetical protein SAMN04488144_12120 [Methylobacterium sp. 190mf]